MIISRSILRFSVNGQSFTEVGYKFRPLCLLFLFSNITWSKISLEHTSHTHTENMDPLAKAMAAAAEVNKRLSKLRNPLLQGQN